MKLQRHIAFTFVCLTVGLVLLISGVEYYFVNQNTFEDFYKRLEIRAIVAGKIRFEEGEMAKSAFEEVRLQHLETLPHEREYIIAESSLRNGSTPVNIKVPSGFYSTALKKGTARHRDGSTFYLGYTYRNKGDDHLIIISARNEFIGSYLTNLRKIIIISVICTAAVAGLLSLWFSRIMLEPIRAITKKVQDISATQLHLRLDADKGREEISELASTFNNMLDRLESTFETQKNFISNASHELNTPLTAIIGESEYALSKPRTEAQYTQSLAAILIEAERLRKITASLLHLAQTGFNGERQEFTPLRMDEVIYIVKGIIDDIIPQNQVYINPGLMPEDQDKLTIKGNMQLLEIALVNVVTNACKYSLNKPVRITLAAASQRVIVTIEDQGIGIPSEEIAYIYEPFFRASNTGSFYGYGIGMPLARNIIRIHNGELEVSSKVNVGTKIKMSFPILVQ